MTKTGIVTALLTVKYCDACIVTITMRTDDDGWGRMRTDQDEDEDKVNIIIIAAISDYDLCPEHTCIDLDFNPQAWQSNSMDVRHIRGSAWFPSMTGPM
jgi:hypothetical protein